MFSNITYSQLLNFHLIQHDLVTEIPNPAVTVELIGRINGEGDVDTGKSTRILERPVVLEAITRLQKHC